MQNMYKSADSIYAWFYLEKRRMSALVDIIGNG